MYMYFLYNAQTYGACSVHTGTTIYPVAGRPYEIIPFFSSTDTSTRPRRLTCAPSRFNDGASESESDSNLSDAEYDDKLHSNGDASEDEEEDAALAAAFAEAAGALRPIPSK